MPGKQSDQRLGKSNVAGHIICGIIVIASFYGLITNPAHPWSREFFYLILLIMTSYLGIIKVDLK